MGKYDPPDKAALLKANPHLTSIVEVAVESALLEMPEKPHRNPDSSRATETENAKSPPRTQARAVSLHKQNKVPKAGKRGRKSAITPQKVDLICDRLKQGETEQLALVFAGVSSSVWYAAKQRDNDLQERVNQAREQWARTKHAKLAATLFESQWARGAERRALRPRPTKQVEMVKWALTYRVPLNVVAFSSTEIEAACQQFNLHVDTWQRQSAAFGLLPKIYRRRALLRGQQPVQVITPSYFEPEELASNNPFYLW